jgi:hypothetical protein
MDVNKEFEHFFEAIGPLPKRLMDVNKEFEHFFEAIGPLPDKTLALLIQLSPSLQIHQGLERIRE